MRLLTLSILLLCVLAQTAFAQDGEQPLLGKFERTDTTNVKCLYYPSGKVTITRITKNNSPATETRSLVLPVDILPLIADAKGGMADVSFFDVRITDPVIRYYVAAPYNLAAVMLKEINPKEVLLNHSSATPALTGLLDFACTDKSLKAPEKSEQYKCVQTVNCQPGAEGMWGKNSVNYCSKDYLAWAEKNCGGRPQIVQ